MLSALLGLWPSTVAAQDAGGPAGGVYWVRATRNTIRVGEPTPFVVAGPEGPRSGVQVTARLVQAPDAGAVGWLDGGVSAADGQVAFVFDHAGDWEVTAVVPGGPPAILPVRVLAAPRMRGRLAFWIPAGIVLLVLNLRALWLVRRSAPSG